jgi:glycerol uptake facilitator-like aquaporin
VGIGVFYFSTQGNSAGMFLSMWIITLFGFNISGAHFNTCITLAQMIRKTKTKMGQSRLLGIMYIVGQILGGILVGFICLSITKDNWELRAREYPEISN